MKTEPNNPTTSSHHSMQPGSTARTSQLLQPGAYGRLNGYPDSFIGSMGTLNQPFEMRQSHRELPIPNGNNGGFGPFRFGQHPHPNGSGNQNYSLSLYPYTMGDSRASQYTISGPAESFERTPVVPQYTTTPVRTNGLATPRTPQTNESQPKKSVSVKPRRNTAPALTNTSSRGGGEISFEDLPPRDNTTPVSVAQIMFNPSGTSSQLSDADKLYIQFLKQEMINTQNAEDNEGMIDTWDKIVRTKSYKINKACELMLALFDHTIQTGTPLTEKKVTTHYNNPKSRFEALGKTLRTQKTICKHIVEDPYVMQVIDDPVGATRRVSNNRRVNDQKAKAINIGRENMGLKGKGKGAPLERIFTIRKSPAVAQKYNNGGAATDSGSEFASQKTTRTRPRRKAAAKRQYKGIDSDDDEDDDYVDEADITNASPPKRSRRANGAHSRGRTVQPALQLDTNVGPSSSESSNNPSSTSSTKALVQPSVAIITPTHQHSQSEGSYFANGLPNGNVSPPLLPPAMRNGAWDLNGYTSYGHPQQLTLANPFAGPGIDVDGNASFNNELIAFSGPDNNEPFFQLDTSDLANHVGGDL